MAGNALDGPYSWSRTTSLTSHVHSAENYRNVSRYRSTTSDWLQKQQFDWIISIHRFVAKSVPIELHGDEI